MATETEKDLIRSIVTRHTGGASSTPAQPDEDIDYRALARSTAVQMGVDPDLFDSLVRNESAYDPDAISPVGALGLAQLMPDTAAELGYDASDPEQNLQGGAAYLKQMLDRYRGDATKAVAAYNAGPGNVDKYGGVPPFKETQDYVRKVLGGRGPSKLPPPPTPTPGSPPPQGVPEWVPATGQDGQALDPLTRQMIALLGPPPEPNTETPYYLAAPEQPEEAPAAPAPPPHTIGDRMVSAAVSFGRGVTDVPTGLLKSVAIASKHIDALFGQHRELDEYATGYISKQIQDLADYWFPQDEVVKGEFLAHMLPNALGQGAGFLAGGVATGSAYLFPALAGAGIQGAQGYEEAQAAGAPEDIQLYSFLLNAGIGTSEALPIGNLLNRLDKGTGGTFKRALIESGKNTIEEAIQEALLQQVPSNIVAWLYDNQRSIMDQVFVSGEVGGAAGAVQGFLTTLLTHSLGIRTHRMGDPDPKVREEALKEEQEQTETAPWPGQVLPQPPTGPPEPPPPPPPPSPPPGLPPTFPEAAEGLPGPPVGPIPEEQRLPPIEPSGRWTTLELEQARKWIPWITEGEIQSSSDLPALVEVARHRIQAYKEKILTDQATPEELKMLNTPGAPRLLIFKLIEDRLAQRPPTGPAPSTPETPEGPVIERLAPVVPSVRPEVEPAAPPVAPEPVVSAPEAAPVPAEGVDQEEEAIWQALEKLVGKPAEAEVTAAPAEEAVEEEAPEVSAEEQTKQEYFEKVTDELMGESREPFDRIVGEGGVGFQDLAGILGKDAAVELHRSPLNQAYRFKLIRKGKTPLGMDVLAKVLAQQGIQLPATGNREGALAEWLYSRLKERANVRAQVEDYYRKAETEYEKTKAPKWMGEADEDFLAMAERAPARSFKAGENFTGVDGRQYTVQKTKPITISGPEGKGFTVEPDEEIPFVDRFVPGEGGTSFAMAVPEAPKTKAAEDAFASASPEVRHLLLKLGLKMHNRGVRTYGAMQEAITKRLGQPMAKLVPGMHNELRRKLGEVPSAKRPTGPAVGPVVPAGKEAGRGVPTGPLPGREGPAKPGERPAKPEGKAEPPPRAPEPKITREIREGGIATLSRELLPDIERTSFELFPVWRRNEIIEQLGKKPLPHQWENASRALNAFGFHFTKTGIPDSRGQNLYHAFLIADGTGTGKTVSAGLVITKFFERDPNAKILVVVKNEDLANQWKADVAEPMAWKTNLVSRLSGYKEGTVNFITYKRMEMAWTEKRMPELQKYAPDLLLLDESQALKNWLPGRPGADKRAIGSKTALSCEEASRLSKNTLFMSATPFESVLHTAYLTTSKLWHPNIQWRDWLEKNLELTFKDGYWTGLSPKKLAKFHRLMVSKGRMTKSEIDFSKITNREGKRVTLSTENIKVPRTPEQTDEALRITRIFQELIQEPEIKRSPYKRRLVQSIRYLVFRALDEENKLPRAIELGKKAREEGKTVVFTLFRKNDTDLEQWWANVQQGKRASGQGKGYGEKSFMPALIQHLAANGITIKSPVRVLQKAFPDFVPITGDEPSGGPVRTGNLKKLMTGEAPGAILTMAAGGTGLSAHDTIGKYPRVQINVSSPDTAGTMVQVAGRTFRLGSESSTKMFWLFGESPTEGRLAAKIAWRLREMGALVVGQEENPTADEIEQFDFPEDPAREAEELMAEMALKGEKQPMLPGVEPQEKSIEQQIRDLELEKRKQRATGEEAPGGPLFEAAEKQAFEKAQGKLFQGKPVAPAYFLGRAEGFGTVAPQEQWHVTEDVHGLKDSTVGRETLEKLGYYVPEAPTEPTGFERSNLDNIALERKAREIAARGEMDIYEARRQVVRGQTAHISDEEFFREMREAPRTGPTEAQLNARAKQLVDAGTVLTMEDGRLLAEDQLGEGARADQRAAAKQAVLDAGGTEAEFGKLFGWQVTKLAAMPHNEAVAFASTIVNAIRGRETLPLPPRPDEAVNYGFLPHLHRMPNPEGTITNLKSMRDMMHDLEKALSTRQATGWFRPGAKKILAHFELWRNIIRGRVYYDVEVYAHEGGHRLDQLMFPQHPAKGLGSATTPELVQFKKELLAIATAAKPGQSKVSEGFAEFVRFYLTQPEQAKKVAPKFYPWFDATLKSRLPKIYDAFQGLRSDWERMMQADPEAAIQMTIASGTMKGRRIPKDYYPNQMYEAIVDEMAVVRNARDHLLKLGKLWDEKRELPASADPRILASTYVSWPDWVETAVKVGQYAWDKPSVKIGPSLMEIFKPVGKNLMAYEAYAKAREAINDLETKGWDPWEKYGIYEGWARKEIARRKAEFEPVYQQMVTFYSNIVDIWVQSGLMSKETAAKMRSKSGVYSPMWRIFLDQAIEEFEVPGGAGKRFANLPKVTFTRRGSRIETIPSIEAAYKMLMITYKRAEENAVAKSLVELAESVPSGGRDVAALVPRPLAPVMVSPREVLGQLNLPKDVLEEIDPEVLNKAIPIFRPSPFKPKAPYMYVWRGGEQQYFEMDPEIYKALHFLGRHEFGVLDKVLSPFVDALRAGAITLSPSFHIRSFIKDPWTALFQSSNPLLHASYWVPSLFSALVQRDVLGIKFGEAYQRYKRSGGGVSTFMGIQPEDVARLAQRDLKRRYDAGKYWGNPKNWAHEAFGIMSYLGLALEYTPRIAEARVKGLMTAKTRSQFLEAGYAGRNVTVDFNMMGGLSRSLTRSAAFFGVGVSGMARMMREFKDKPFAAMVKFSIFGLLPILYYYLHVRKDERWKAIPQKDRDQNFIFWLPGMDEPRRIPKPHEWGVLMTLVERGLQAQDDRDPSVLTTLAANTARNLPNPVPTGLMLGWELAANYSEHLGRPIAPTRGEPGERYWSYTSETAKGIGRFLHISPPKIEYGLRQVSGGLYTKVVGKAEEALGIKEKRKGLPSGVETPITGALAYRYPGQATEQMNRFYERYWVPASQVYESFTGKRRAEPEDLKRYLEKRSQYIAMYYALRGIERTLSNLRDARDLIASSATMPEDEKRTRLEKLAKEMDAIAQRGNEVGESILGGQMKQAPGVH